ncbi:hypothetical protein ACSBM8_03070 [Sphingomonas sp. ASY06-1R]|jgi:hypothetical protein|uniref:hypothetical protein n=1 Tax=Sphingomonas sp. ASY06-1R TaxID=3445771 RepID=UPI003FA239BE
MKTIRGRFGKWGGAVALAALLVVPATSADAKVRKRSRPASAELAPGFSAFTPAAADPRLAAQFARSGLGTGAFNDSAFRFTPSGPGASRRAITVAVRSRAISRQQAAHALALPSDGLAPFAYSLGASVGWKRFALSGDVQKVDGGLLPTTRESADLGLIFSGKRWATELQVAGERSTGTHNSPIGLDDSWSVGVGGSYAISQRFNVTGGVRYKTQRDQLQSLADDRRDSQAVYLGTTFKF